jgi:hypothetical protein
VENYRDFCGGHFLWPPFFLVPPVQYGQEGEGGEGGGGSKPPLSYINFKFLKDEVGDLGAPGEKVAGGTFIKYGDALLFFKILNASRYV